MPGGVLHHRARVLRDPAGIVEVVAANLELQAARAAVVVLAAAAEEPHDLVVAAGRVGADDDAGQAGQLPAQRDGDLLVGARALIARHQHDADLTAVRAAAAAALPVVAAAAALGDDASWPPARSP